MARKAKKELIPEERLAAARVPKEEWPYELPEGWEWVRLEGVAEWGSGGTPSRKHPEYYEGSIPWIKTGELNDGYINETEEHITEDAIQHSSAKIFPVNTVAVAMYGATIGKVGILGVEAATNQACACGIVDETTGFKYLFYYLRSQKDAFIKKGKGGAQSNISQTVIKSHPIPLPPLEIQQRIVDHIESLFAKLDQAKEKAQQALATSETRKAAILHQAFTGQLTAQWREENGVSMDSWEETALKNVSKLQTGLMKGKRYSTETTMLPYLRVANVQDGYLNLSEIKEIEVEVTKVDRYLLKDGDVLFTEGGDYDKLGRGTVWKNEIENCLHQNHIFVVRVDKEVLNPYFLSYQAGSRYGKKYFVSCSKQTTNLASINSTQLKNFPVILPSLSEQQEIVRILDTLMANEQRIQQAVETILQQIDDTKKSILAKAFRGEWQTTLDNI